MALLNLGGLGVRCLSRPSHKRLGTAIMAFPSSVGLSARHLCIAPMTLPAIVAAKFNLASGIRAMKLMFCCNPCPAEAAEDMTQTAAPRVIKMRFKSAPSILRPSRPKHRPFLQSEAASNARRISLRSTSSPSKADRQSADARCHLGPRWVHFRSCSAAPLTLLHP